ncbi:hypothetical protein [Bifidobacterium callitrichos]|uniref:Uncharacterized protein n=1 Tax=Bifidobacterium callitrichos DSM 23973 TaxID=1437609 RepID=A0A087ACQ7_9BIFI|nr:hypothetical protein [Bifidobacterium callitrichos]KFI56557.1 hypothetical protein BCAL_0152 [Bifidobacterium callitrichos DSM 23973]
MTDTRVDVWYRVGDGPRRRITDTIVGDALAVGAGVSAYALTELLRRVPERAHVTEVIIERNEP